jgi:tetratricopeptide (TPR) repeat protein
MNKIAILSLSAFVLAGCNSSTQTTQTVKTNPSNTELVSSHSQPTQTENSTPTPTPVPKSETKTKWTQSGSPIDTTSFDAEIKDAETKLKGNAKDESLKKSLAEAFNKRGIALTEARQYASALGDYRKALKLDPNNEEAKKWIDQIIGIYAMLNKDYPKEGEEPPALPFKQS